MKAVDSKSWYQSRRVRLFAGLVAMFLLLFGAMRLAFYLLFYKYAGPIDVGELIHAFYIGGKFDLRLALILVLPLVVFAAIPRFGLGHVRFFSVLGKVYLWVAISLILLLYIFDFYHYDYLGLRIDASILRFAQDVSISSEMVWQSYPVVWSTLGWLALCCGAALVVNRLFRMTVDRPFTPVSIRQRLIGGVVVFVCVVAGIYGQWSFFPLRWSNALFSDNKLVSSLALNPVLYFRSTFKNRGRTFDVELTRHYYPLIAERLHVDTFDPETLNYDRKHPGASPPPDPLPNVVLVMLESFSAHWLGAQGNALDPTPNMDRIIEKSLYFRKNYVPAFGTARSTWAVVTGIPDVSTVRTATRNPLIVKQHSIINAFEGYDKYYFLGGSANWANLRGLLQQSIPDLQLFEEGDYDGYAREDVWGVSDLSVFQKALEVLSGRDSGRPFFAYIQTAANHAPYTIPEVTLGFQEKQLDHNRLIAAGFASNAEYNGAHLLDHFVGKFMEWMEKESFAANTIFAFFGDHGLASPSAPNQDADHVFDIVKLRAPIWIYAPSLGLKPGTVDTVTSLLDLMPTVAGLAGVPYLNTTMGQDVLGGGLDPDRYAFLVDNGPRGIHRIGYVGRSFYLGVDADGQFAELHDTSNMKRAAQNVASRHPQGTEQLRQEALATYETAQYMLHHNPPRPHR